MKHEGQGNNQSQGGDYQKYLKQYAGDYQKYMKQGGQDGQQSQATSVAVVSRSAYYVDSPQGELTDEESRISLAEQPPISMSSGALKVFVLFGVAFTLFVANRPKLVTPDCYAHLLEEP